MMQLSSLFLYVRPVALDRDRHAARKLNPPADLGFTAGAAVVPLLSAEFTHAAREYPIVFVRGVEQELIPVVLTGVPGGHNVYVDDASRWNARYVPAYVRRYPFAFAHTASEQYIGLIYAHLLSLGNVLELLHRQPLAAAAATPSPEPSAMHSSPSLVTH
jgi:hypothetical protein